MRYDYKTKRVITVDVLNFSHRVAASFGTSLTYSERSDLDMIKILMPEMKDHSQDSKIRRSASSAFVRDVQKLEVKNELQDL